MQINAFQTPLGFEVQNFVFKYKFVFTASTSSYIDYWHTSLTSSRRVWTLPLTDVRVPVTPTELTYDLNNIFHIASKTVNDNRSLIWQRNVNSIMIKGENCFLIKILALSLSMLSIKFCLYMKTKPREQYTPIKQKSVSLLPKEYC